MTTKILKSTSHILLLFAYILILPSCKSGLRPAAASSSEIQAADDESEVSQSTFPSWKADAATLDAKLQIIQSALSRHPQLVTANLAFQRNLLELMNPVAEITKALGPAAADMSIPSSEPLHVYYYDGADLRVNEPLMKSLKNKIGAAYRDISKAIRKTGGGIKDFRSTALTLSTSSPALLSKFLVIAPLIFDATKGESKFESEADFSNHLSSLGTTEIAGAYQDEWK